MRHSMASGRLLTVRTAAVGGLRRLLRGSYGMSKQIPFLSRLSSMGGALEECQAPSCRSRALHNRDIGASLGAAWPFFEIARQNMT